MTTTNLPDTTPNEPRRPFTLRAALSLMAGISIASVSIYLLCRKNTSRVVRTGIKSLPVVLPIILDRRRDRQPAPVAAPAQHSKFYRIAAYVLPVVLCLALGWLAGWLQRDAMTEWYPALLKPAGTPPNLVFPIVWGVIYLLMGISAGRILTAPEGPHYGAMTLWGIQLGVNFLWSILFFVCRSPLLGLIGIVVLDALAMVYIARSYRIRRDAAWMFAPYLAWILYATYLNGWILAANGPGI
mgnify:FL=1